MKADAEQFRKRIDALWGNHDALLSQIFRDGWKLEPPDPGWRTATSQASPTPQTFYHKKIGIWLPHVFFEDVPAPPCPTKDCMGKDCLVDVNSGREWPTGLHRVFGVFGSWWLDTCKFTCRRCGARFHATSADSVAQLPLHARLTFDVFMGKKYACDAALAKLIEDTWEPMGTSPTQLLLHHFYSENHYAAELKYYAVTVQRRADERADDDASTPAGAAPTAQSLALTGLDGAAAKAVRIANELVRRRRDDDARRQRPQRTELKKLKSFGGEKVNADGPAASAAPPDDRALRLPAPGDRTAAALLRAAAIRRRARHRGAVAGHARTEARRRPEAGLPARVPSVRSPARRALGHWLALRGALHPPPA